MALTVKNIAQHVGGTVQGDENIEISGASRIEEAQPGDITFLSNEKYLPFALNSKASAILIGNQFNPKDFAGITTIAVENIYKALADVISLFSIKNTIMGDVEHGLSFISKEADVDISAYIGRFSIVEKGAVIGHGAIVHDQCYIGHNVFVGPGTVIHPGVKVYDNCRIGRQCIIHSNAVIGSDGFGFAQKEDGSFYKIPQIGNVVIEDNVEIGANTVIDRATMGSTVIREGAKLDNLIQIAHNVEIGPNTVMAAQSGVAGSTRIGGNSKIGGQAGIVGHLKLHEGTMIQAQSGMTKNTTSKNSRWYGSPAINYTGYLKAFAIFRRLPQLEKRLKNIESKLKSKD